MSLTVHMCSYNEEEILPYSLRHYATFADHIVLHDALSTDRTREIAKSFGVEILDWDTGGEINDLKIAELKNNCWRSSLSHFVCMVDADELVYFPLGAKATLAVLEAARVPVVKPYGYEIVSDVYPTGPGQIYDEVKMGARDDDWYAKPCLWSPPLLRNVRLELGAHWGHFTTTAGNVLRVDHNYPKTIPPVYLIHCHHLGPISRLAALYDGKIKRSSEVNRRMNLGNFEPGIKHATDKRNRINAKLERIFA